MNTRRSTDQSTAGAGVAGALMALLFGIPLAFHVIGYLVA